ncbi:hypothetical protein PMAYCL1PPCAC_23950, partial [Pristionchus mayeri]
GTVYTHLFDNVKVEHDRAMSDVAYLEQKNELVSRELCNACGRTIAGRDNSACARGAFSCSEMKITVATCKIKKQVESILRSSLDEIITIHRNTHDMISGTVPNEGTDIHCFQNFQESIENLRDFKEKRIRISLSICIDGFPLYKKTK